ncbi:hypothetical protein VTN96DRAFT_8588 [Rasamsonia emersonii]|uniref:Isochorismatase hydrolase n=1 Tax=Rasamsonia emersonii (strain ATCC 16479 / CBS 393.64 / IMI 116815) TaxID=1408163 RepID=A0A0F4YKN2_RASE3|nr:Isochorismatase hydrolase [Rasamsonia emersonii CBS 393.64]KKA18143.1 Isochorismatase hydrolase [Rasamsonia emersonii CBS 393.64]
MATNKTVLLVMDLQQGIVSLFPNSGEYIARVAKAIHAARAKDIPIIYVTVNFRQGYPEVSRRNKAFSTVLANSGNAFEEGNSAVHIVDDIAPMAGKDILVTKRRVSAFAGSDLDVVLRSLGAETLVLTGVATSGVVLSTLRQAADLDYAVTVLEDLCMDLDPEVHRVLVEKVFPRQAEVVSSETWIQSL